MTTRIPPLSDLLGVAEALAQAAGQATLAHFGGRLAADTKGDGTPVTVADRAAETLLREGIAQRYPTHGILGEEFGETNPGSPVRWILDPIDGTRSFMRGVPLYGVLVGIQVRGEAAVGVIHLPALGETVAAAMGEGCFWNGSRARVSEVSDLSGAAALITEPGDHLEGPMGAGWQALVKQTSLARSWGDCYGHVLVATGRAEIMVDPILSIWDAAPILPIIQEAGGTFTDKDGIPRIEGASGISTNGILHETVMKLLRGPGE